MPTLWIFDIEAHEQRYTGEWQKYLPKQLESFIAKRNLSDWYVDLVPSHSTGGSLPKGAFLNFADTNIYKASQVANFSKFVSEGKIVNGDRVLFTDAWHPGVIHCRYMASLLNLKLSIHVMWHAGSYDANDLLGQKNKPNKAWCYAFEKSVFEAANKNYFATEYHKKLFLKEIIPYTVRSARVVGWPMEYLTKLLKDRHEDRPKDVILFPHRLSVEKQPQILKNIASRFPKYPVIFAQEHGLRKPEYHDLLARSIVCFSASKQETLGIGTYEAMLCGAIPIVPKKLSYKEIYGDLCYSADWVQNIEKAKRHDMQLVLFIQQMIAQHTPADMHKAALKIGKKYFDGGKLYAELFRR